jgi:hypothetical protein
MAYRPELDDPFYGGEKIPSLSWRNLPHGSTFRLEILEEARLLQSRDFETQELAWWDKEKTRPILSAVVNVQVLDGPHSVGEKRSIWAQKPSNMFMALLEAQKTVGQKFLPGGLLQLKFTGEEKHKDPRMNPIKQYAAKYTPPAQPDPFSETTTPAKPQTASTATW